MAFLATRASPGPTLPPTPSTMMSPSSLATSSAKASEGSVNFSSSWLTVLITHPLNETHPWAASILRRLVIAQTTGSSLTCVLSAPSDSTGVRLLPARTRQPGFGDHAADLLPLRLRDALQRGTHVGLVKPTEDDEGFLHPVVPVEERFSIGDLYHRVDPIRHLAGTLQVAARQGLEHLRVQIGDHAPVSGEDAVGADTKGREQGFAKAAQNRDVLIQRLELSIVPLVGADVVGPFLNSDNVVDLVANLDQVLSRYMQARSCRINEHDDRKDRSFSYRGDVPVRYLGTELVAKVENRRGEHQKTIRSLSLGHLRDLGGLMGAVLIHAAYDGDLPRHFVKRYVEAALLLFERQRRHLGSVSVGGEAGYARGVYQVADMPTVVSFVDPQVSVERHQVGGYDPTKNQLGFHVTQLLPFRLLCEAL